MNLVQEMSFAGVQSAVCVCARACVRVRVLVCLFVCVVYVCLRACLCECACTCECVRVLVGGRTRMQVSWRESQKGSLANPLCRLPAFDEKFH